MSHQQSGKPLSSASVQDSLESEHRFVNWMKAKHSTQSQAFVDELVKDCRREFAKCNCTTDLDRSKVYQRVRNKLQAHYDSRLKAIARTCCSS
jgi:hypothetical protein